jgi:nitrite reductase (NO-forming)
VTEGNTNTFRILNYDTENTHLVDFHAIVGHRGGAPVYGAPPATVDPESGELVPGEGCATFTFNNPGLYVYHCVGDGFPGQIAAHMNNGMFGLILVEPEGGRRDDDDDDRDDGYRKHRGSLPFTQLTRGSKEFYLFQQDIWASPSDGTDGVTPGVYDFDEGMMMSNPAGANYSVFNGRVGALIDYPVLAEAGKNATVYFGLEGGHISSLHAIGELWDWQWSEGDILAENPQQNIQTSLVPSAGSLAVVMDGDELVPTELDVLFSCAVPPNLAVFVDHASPYFRKGALGAFATVGEGSSGDSAACYP